MRAKRSMEGRERPTLLPTNLLHVLHAGTRAAVMRMLTHTSVLVHTPQAKEVRQQLADIMTQSGLAVTSAGSDWDIVRKAVCSAYFQVRGHT